MTDVSIVLATYRRPDILERTLAGYQDLTAPDTAWTVIIVDNADDARTRAVVEAHAGRLPLEYHVCTGIGKNHAMNYGIEQATSELLVFTDDDAVPHPDWLVEMLAGVARWPEVTVFAGRIEPIWLGPALEKEHDRPFVRGLLALTTWDREEGPIGWNKVWGPNMAVRAAVFREGLRFDTAVGPSTSDFLLGGEVDLTRRLAERGHRAVFLPKAVVGHQVRPEQLEESWLVQRSTRLGRGVAHQHALGRGASSRVRTPSRVYRNLAASAMTWLRGVVTRDEATRHRGKLDVFFARGQLSQYRAERRTEAPHG